MPIGCPAYKVKKVGVSIMLYALQLPSKCFLFYNTDKTLQTEWDKATKSAAGPEVDGIELVFGEMICRVAVGKNSLCGVRFFVDILYCNAKAL